MRFNHELLHHSINWLDTHIQEIMVLLSFCIAFIFSFSHTPHHLVLADLAPANIKNAITPELLANGLVGLIFSLATVIISTTLVHFLKLYLNQKYGNQKGK